MLSLVAVDEGEVVAAVKDAIPVAEVALAVKVEGRVFGVVARRELSHLAGLPSGGLGLYDLPLQVGEGLQVGIQV